MERRRSRCRAPRRRRCRGLDLTICRAAGVPTLDTPERCRGYVARDLQRARDELVVDLAEAAWVRGRMLRVTYSYAELLGQDRDAVTPRCAAGIGAALVTGVRGARATSPGSTRATGR